MEKTIHTSLYILCLFFLALLLLPKKTAAQCLGSIELNVVASPEPDISGNTEICPGNSTTLSVAGGPFDTYAWSTGSSDPTITVSNTGTYTVVVSNAAGCTGQAQQVVTAITAPAPVITEQPYQCNGEITLDAGTGFDSYAWSTGGSGQTITVTSAGTFTVTVTNANGCTGTDSYAVTIPTAPSVDITGDLEFCEGENTTLTATSGFNTYAWTGGGSGQTLTVNSPGTYGVTVTDADGCTAENSVTVTENPFTPPTISGPAQFCPGTTIELTAGSGPYTTYAWTGGGSGPTITVSSPGTYTVTVTAANGCTGTASQTVTASPQPNPTITGNLIICNGNSTTLGVTPSFPTYAWSTGSTDPSITVNVVGPYSVTVTNAQGCTGTASVTVSAGTPPVVTINPVATPLCEDDPAITLTANPPGGTWSGNIGPNGLLDPAALGPGSFVATYTFTDPNGCTGSDDFAFEILPLTPVGIQPAGPFCPSDPIQTLVGTPAGGTWGGIANSFGQFDPGTFAPGIYQVTYTASLPGSCPDEAIIFIEIRSAPTAVIQGSGTICQGSGQSLPISITTSGNGPFQVTYTLNGGSPTTLTVPLGTTTFNTSNPGTYEISSVVDVNGCPGTGSGQAVVEVVGAPSVTSLEFQCDGVQENYTVIFEIIGGDPATYSVTANVPGGNLSTTPPYIFTGPFIPSGNPYQFVVTDANNCNPVTLSGTFNCDCQTDAGDMNLTAISICEGQTATATHLGGEELDNNDNLVFVLHSGNGNSLGNIFGTSPNPAFDFAPPLVAGVTYFISAVAGNDDGAGGVDLTDPCLSVSFGTPVVWNPAPSGSLADDAAICEGESSTLVFSLSGNAPFDVSYSDGSQTFDLANIFNGHIITVLPTATTTYTLLTVSDNTNPACSASPNSAVTVTVNPTVSVTETAEICEGESIILGGAPQTVAGVYTDTLSTAAGCDSIVVTTLTVNSSDTTELSATSCDPSQVGVFTDIFSNQNGCDSVVVTTVTLLPGDSISLADTTCDPTLAGVFTEIFSNQNGCDSVVVTTVSLLPPGECGVDFLLSGETIPCDEESGSLTLEILQGGLPIAYEFVSDSGLSGDGTIDSSPFILSDLPPGEYTFTLTLASGQSASQVFNLTQATPPEVEVEVTTGLDCSNEPTGALQATATGGFGPYDFTWSNGGTGEVLSGLEAGVYEVTVSGDFGCEVVASVELSDAPVPMLTFTVNQPDCFDVDGGFLEAVASGGLAPYQYSLNGGAFQAENTFGGLSAGAYEVTVQSADGCEATEGFAVNAPLEVDVELGNDLTIELGDEVTLTAIVNLLPDVLQAIDWTGLGDPECPTCLSQTVTPLLTTSYSISVETAGGCRDEDGLTIFVDRRKQLYVPNAFSPNGDGVNDAFFPFARTASVREVKTFLVFSRWGESVFEGKNFQPNDTSQGWDGTHRGQALNPAVFVWFAEIEFIDGTVEFFEGEVMLVK
ncbi:MAG: gliding motility-associated C-terminal domain-containing protein [Lewinellaceae bacterium]|nr:gliding motility-associated C-terminal domain-containing protein [Lewinellaceae bacterium]